MPSRVAFWRVGARIGGDFNVIRTDRPGRFHSTYRFQQPGAATYRFRALSLAEAAYPYMAGGSNVVRVRKL